MALSARKAYLWCGEGVKSITWEWVKNGTQQKSGVCTSTSSDNVIVPIGFDSGAIYFTNIALTSESYDANTLTWHYNTSGGVYDSWKYGGNYTSASAAMTASSSYDRKGYWAADKKPSTVVVYLYDGTTYVTSYTNQALGSTITLPSSRTASSNFTVTWDYNYGTPSTKSYTYRTPNFEGWTYNGATHQGSFTIPSTFTGASIYLYAAWSASVPAISSPTRTGYTFAGWYTASSGGSLVTFPENISGDTTFYAHWDEISTVTITYNRGLGTSGEDFHDYPPSGSAYSVESCPSSFKKEHTVTLQYPGYQTSPTVSCPFNYWMSSDWEARSQGAIIYPTQDMTFYAQWSAGTCTLPENASYGGYIFEGWYTSSDYSGSAVSGDQSITQDTTFYAKFRAPNTYYISYSGNGATSGSMEPTTVTENSITKLPANNFERKYAVTFDRNCDELTDSTETAKWKFSGWKWNGKTYEDEDTIDANEITANVSFVAQWTFGSTVFPTEPSRDGYAFDGWYDAASGGTQYTSTTTISKDMTLYAHWTAKTQKPTITYKSRTDSEIVVAIGNLATSGTYYIEWATDKGFASIIDKTSPLVAEKVTSNPDFTATGLTENTKYYIRACHKVGESIATSDPLEKSTRISTFQWTANDSNQVVAGQAFQDVITAAKWNDLGERINWCKKEKGYTQTDMTTAEANKTEMTAALFKEVRDAIAGMDTNVVASKQSGEEIKAAYFANETNSLKTAVNRIILSL